MDNFLFLYYTKEKYKNGEKMRKENGKENFVKEFYEKVPLIQEIYLPKIINEFGKYYNVSNKMDLITFTKVKFSPNTKPFYNNIFNVI